MDFRNNVFINESIKIFEKQNYLIIQLNNDYKIEKEKYPQFINAYEVEADSKFNIVLNKLNKINLTNITVNLTDTQSLFFRFYNIKDDNNYYSFDIHLEVFFDEVNEECFEAICSIYKGNEKCFSDYGKLNDTLDSILDFLLPTNTNTRN